MKIIQIMPVANKDGFTTVFGLSENNEVFTYSYKTGNWKQFKATETK